MGCPWNTPGGAAEAIRLCLEQFAWGTPSLSVIVGFNPLHGRDCCAGNEVGVSLDGEASPVNPDDTSITGGAPCDTTWQQDIRIEYKKCWSSFDGDETGNPPPAADVRAAFLALIDQMWAVLQHLQSCICDYDGGTCDAQLVSCAGDPPDASCAGWHIVMRVFLQPCGCNHP